MVEKISRKINILELNTSFSIGGAQRTMMNFCRHLNRDLFNVYAAFYGDGGVGTAGLEEMGVGYMVAGFDVNKLLRFIRDKKIDILHFHRSGRFFQIEYEIMKKAREVLPKIAIIETNVFGQFDPQSDKFVDCHLIKSKMMLNERFVKEAGNFDFGRMRVLYNPVDYRKFEDFAISDKEVDDFRKKLGLKGGDFVIGKLGRSHIAKWSDLILDMMPYALKLIPNLKIIIQAAPKSRAEQIRKSRFSDSFILLEETNSDRDIALFYKVVDVYVHASKIGESFGNTLAEAGVFKKPVVVNSTPRKDNNQIELINHMKTGIIANHPQTFARAIEYFYKNPRARKEMGENGYVKVVSEYDPIKITGQLEKVFIENLEKKGFMFNSEISDFYGKIKNRPNEAEIMDYKNEYKKLLKQEFGVLSVAEKVVNFKAIPGKLYFKLKDFLQDKKIWK